jgi:hypothetical protein
VSLIGKAAEAKRSDSPLLHIPTLGSERSHVVEARGSARAGICDNSPDAAASGKDEADQGILVDNYQNGELFCHRLRR